MSGNVDAISFLLEKGGDINHVDKEKHSLVQWAVVCRQPEALTTLLDRGAIPSTPDLFGAHALHYATMISEHEPDIGHHTLHILLKHGANVNCGDMDERTPLLWAASAGAI
jgi:ankyrin repeat protein